MHAQLKLMLYHLAKQTALTLIISEPVVRCSRPHLAAEAADVNRSGGYRSPPLIPPCQKQARLTSGSLLVVRLRVSKAAQAVMLQSAEAQGCKALEV